MKFPTGFMVISKTTGPGPVSGGRNSSPIPAFSQPIALDGAKLGMEASCREAPWPCAVANAAPAQNRPAKIVRAAVRFFALLSGENADIDGLLNFGFYLRRHAWRKNVSGIVQGWPGLETPRFEPAYAASRTFAACWRSQNAETPTRSNGCSLNTNLRIMS
jgi:hypothetical protein